MFGLWWQALPPGEGQQAGDSDRKPQTAFEQLRAGNRKGVGAGALLGRREREAVMEDTQRRGVYVL